METYVMQSEKAMCTGKQEDLPKIIQTKLAEENRAKHHQAQAKESSAPKTAEIVAARPTVRGTSTTRSTTAVAGAK